MFVRLRLSPIVIPLLLLIGCAAPQKDSGPSIVDQLNRVQIGMSESEVKSIIGQPDGVKLSRSAVGIRSQWIYSATTLVRNVRGDKAALGYAFGLGWRGTTEENFYLHFENGKLTSTQGF